MANRDTPIGFRPAQGIGSQHVFKMFRVDVNNSTAVFIGDVMDLDGEGVGPASADAGVSVAGICIAVYDSGGIPCGSWASSVATKHLTTGTEGFALVALAIPGAVFIVQTQSGTTPTVDDIGLTSDHVTGTGDTVTSQSRNELTHSGGGLQFRIIGKVEEPGNTWGVNVDVYVVFNESAFGVSAAASV